jgi:hypothetical protein
VWRSPLGSTGPSQLSRCSRRTRRRLPAPHRNLHLCETTKYGYLWQVRIRILRCFNVITVSRMRMQWNNGNCVPADLTISHSAFCIYEFCMVLCLNSH